MADNKTGFELEPITVQDCDEILFGVLQTECEDCVFAGMLVHRLGSAVFDGLVSVTDAKILLQDINADCSAGNLSGTYTPKYAKWLAEGLARELLSA